MNQDLLLLKNEIKKLTIKVGSLKQSKPGLLHAIQQKFMIEWTYNSNALEGNTLTLGETAFFLQQGLTSEGRPLKDFVETKNHAEAIKSLENFIGSKQSLTEHFIKSLHAVLLKDIDHTIAQNQEGHKIKKPLQAGQYKKRPNHVLTLSGNIHHYTDPLQVTPEIGALVQWYNEQSLKGEPLEIAAELHYRFVAIHPFDDGNGRLARLLMNLVLIKAGYPPCIIQNIHRKEYLEVLELIDQTKNLIPLHIFIAQELKHSLELELMVLEPKAENQGVLTNQASLKLNVFQREKMILESITEPVSIGQIEESLGVIKRPTLKKDLQRLVLEGKIKRKGVGRGILYFQ